MPIEGLGAVEEVFNGSDLKIGIVHARWNREIIDDLVEGAILQMASMGVSRDNIKLLTVPGSYELPTGVRTIVKMHDLDAVIAIGVLIKGETMHFEYICETVSHELMRLPTLVKMPVIFGVLTCLTEEQAKSRAAKYPDPHNHGASWGSAAVEMACKTKSFSVWG